MKIPTYVGVDTINANEERRKEVMRTRSAVIGIVMKARAGRDGLYGLSVYVAWHGERIERSTGISIPFENWDRVNQRVVGMDGMRRLNERLDGMLAILREKRDALDVEGVSYMSRDIMSALDEARDGLSSVGQSSSDDGILFSRLMEAFIRSRKLSWSSRQSYERFGKCFMGYFGDVEVNANLDYSGFMEHLNSIYASTSSFQLFRCLTAVYNYGMEKGWIKGVSPLGNLNVRKPGKKRPKIALDDAMIGKLAKWLEKRCAYDYASGSFIKGAHLANPNRQECAVALYLMMYYLSGLSPIDLAQLKADMLIVDNGARCFVRDRQKTGRGCYIVLSDANKFYVSLFNFYLNTSSSRLGHIFPFLYWSPNCVKKYKKGFSEQQVYTRVRFVLYRLNQRLRQVVQQLNAEGAGIPSTLTFYSARHSFATRFISRSSNINALCSAMGRSANTIATYISELQNAQVMKNELNKLF